MILVWLILIPFIGGLLSWQGEMIFGRKFPRWTALLSMLIALGISLWLWMTGDYSLSLPRAGLLLSLLIFPLYVPVLIFGAGAMQAAIIGLPATGALYLLGALLALGVTAAPWAIAAALKISLE